eukprot:5203342-Pleurochrysis_carterae.AAC.1
MLLDKGLREELACKARSHPKVPDVVGAGRVCYSRFNYERVRSEVHACGRCAVAPSHVHQQQFGLKLYKVFEISMISRKEEAINLAPWPY